MRGRQPLPQHAAGLRAVTFIETRDAGAARGGGSHRSYLARYDVETRGVYIQDVDVPDAARRGAHRTARSRTSRRRRSSRSSAGPGRARASMEKSRGHRRHAGQLAASQVAIDIASTGRAHGRPRPTASRPTRAQRAGRSRRDQGKGRGRGRRDEAIGLARAAGYEAQVEALGQGATAIVAVANEISDGKIKIVPDVLVAGGGGSIEGLAATLMGQIASNGKSGNGKQKPTPPAEATPRPKDAPKPV